MKIGIITDIHNNSIALKAVLNKFSLLGIKRIICCGDIIGIGPEPEETVKMIMQLRNLVCVRGNHENYLINGIPSEVPNDEFMGFAEMEHHKWEHSKLSNEFISFLESLPFSKAIEINSKRIYISHYSLNNENNYINYTENPKLIGSDIIIYGHNHNPSYKIKANKWFINSGSLGCPIGTSGKARAGVLNIEDNIVDYEQINVNYDINKVIDRIKKIKYPDYENILKYFYGV